MYTHHNGIALSAYLGIFWQLAQPTRLHQLLQQLWLPSGQALPNENHLMVADLGMSKSIMVVCPPDAFITGKTRQFLQPGSKHGDLHHAWVPACWLVSSRTNQGVPWRA